MDTYMYRLRCKMVDSMWQKLKLYDDFKLGSIFLFNKETEKGKFARTDRYVAHLVIKGDSKTTKEVLLVTDRWSFGFILRKNIPHTYSGRQSITIQQYNKRILDKLYNMVLSLSNYKSYVTLLQFYQSHISLI